MLSESSIMRRILITGGFGFIGANLIEALLQSENSAEILIVDNLVTGTFRPNFLSPSSRVCFIEADICLYDFNKLGNVDEIYHLACPASPKAYQRVPLFTLNTCYMGTKNVLDYAQSCRAQVVFTSTSEVYGDPLVTPQYEHYHGNLTTQSPRSCYDEGKRVAETLCYEYGKLGLNVRIARLFNSYGPFMARDDGRMVSNFITQTLQGKAITIQGDGLQTRSLCYVTDTVAGLIKLMSLKTTGLITVNIGNNHEVTVLQVAQQIVDLLDKPFAATYHSLPEGDPKQRCPGLTLAKQLLNWQPKISLLDGLKSTIHYFQCDSV